MKKLFSLLTTMVLILLYCLNLYATDTIDQVDILTENENISFSLEEDYTIVEYDMINDVETVRQIDFSTGSTMALNSNEDWNLISEPYTPPNKVGEESASTYGMIGNTALQSVDETVSPYCRIVYISATFEYEEDGEQKSISLRGSGVILGPDLVLTNGHVIYMANYGGWADKVYVYTEKTSQTNYNEKAWVYSMTIHDKCMEQDGNYDWAYLRTETDIGNRQGWMGFSSESPYTYIGRDVVVAGYPGGVYEMKKDTGKIEAVASSYLLYASVSGQGGMSGSPIFSPEDNYVRAIYTGPGQTDENGELITNRGIVITAELFQLLREAKNDGIEKYS